MGIPSLPNKKKKHRYSKLLINNKINEYLTVGNSKPNLANTTCYIRIYKNNKFGLSDLKNVYWYFK